MADLSGAFEAWKSEPFPPGDSADEGLSDIRSDLALVDTWLVGTVLMFVKRDVFRVAVPDVLGTVRRLQDQLATVARSTTNATDVALAEDCLRYATKQFEVYEAYLEHARRQELTPEP